MKITKVEAFWLCRRCGRAFKALWGIKKITNRFTGKRYKGIYCPECVKALRNETDGVYGDEADLDWFQ